MEHELDAVLQTLWLLRRRTPDRVRLGDLDPRRLRFEPSQDLIGFAERLITNAQLEEGRMQRRSSPPAVTESHRILLTEARRGADTRPYRMAHGMRSVVRVGRGARMA